MQLNCAYDPMSRKLVTLLRRAVLILALVLGTVLAVRAYDSQRGEPLEPWHTHVPHELHADELDHAGWADYVAAEAAALEEVRREVTEQLPTQDRVTYNRYFADSPVYPGHFKQDWNRSYLLQPQEPPAGAVVLLHGLTDSPYSLRHIAQRYQERGWVVVAIRLPGHGTVPAGLTDADWEDWAAASRLAVREARNRGGGSVPLHLVGFSNGGALAVKYALDALSDETLTRPSRLVLISPMIGVTSMARFAGIFGWPAVLPAFAKAAWLSVLPEFNPFKYNSFPIHAARQSCQLTRHIQRQIAEQTRSGQIARLPPILTLQSVLDYTVSTRAIIDGLYRHLPENGSELVLFDLNQNAQLGLLMRTDNNALVSRLLPAVPRHYSTAVISNAGSAALEVHEEITPSGSTTRQRHRLDLSYPPDVYSLSHVALPFPPDDSLYGMEPRSDENFGVQLGGMAARGERAALIVSLDVLIRMTSNPFFPYLLQRIEADITADQGRTIQP
jgi:alpha-beta hydrolase superfamily lysophospholipase